MTKRILFFFLIAFVASSTTAQGNLQFNRVIFMNLDIDYAGQSFPNTPAQPSVMQIFNQQTLVVPAGKVVKLERANAYLHSYGSTQCSAPVQVAPSDSLSVTPNTLRAPAITINGTMIYSPNSTGSQEAIRNDAPIWLPAGTYVIKLTGRTVSINCASGYHFHQAKYRGFVSGIEFNIIP